MEVCRLFQLHLTSILRTLAAPCLHLKPYQPSPPPASGWETLLSHVVLPPYPQQSVSLVTLSEWLESDPCLLGPL